MGNETQPTDLTRLEKALTGLNRQQLTGERRAAVCAICRSDSEGRCEILFIHRAEDPRDPWSGHMAFPGGRVDPSDDSPLRAAVRETREEMGFDLDEHARLIGRLSDVTAVARGRRLGLIIEPFVFKLTTTPTFQTNREVQDTLWIPLAFFLDDDNRSNLDYDHGEITVTLPCYRWKSKVVWGLTLRMIDEIGSVMSGTQHHDWPSF